MLELSQDPVLAQKQMEAVIFYLTTFGYIDGDFDLSEKAFVRGYIRKLIEHRVETERKTLTAEVRQELVDRFTAQFHVVFESIDKQVSALFTESVAHDEDDNHYVHSRLKVMCFEIFKQFDRSGQEQLLDTVDELLMADGEAHPAEIKFRAELAELLEAELHVTLVEEESPPRVELVAVQSRPSQAAVHPFFDQFEHDYADDPEVVLRQINADRQAISRTLGVLGEWRNKGVGKLNGKHSVADLVGQGLFLDGHTWACSPELGRRYELTVLGDLHGCYSCLKAAIMQARFFDKVRAFREDPTHNPEPKLVLLGDYIDRGIFGLNGVLRAVMLLFCTAPEHVVVLRGNHEYFVEMDGNVYGGVRPSEAIDGLKRRAPLEVARDYLRLFEALPTTFLFERTVFVHGGIPRDHTLKQQYTDLGSLNRYDLRFEMMWSDPSSVDVIPASLQEQSARFPFGRMQAQRFLQRLGCHTLVRGHERVKEGFRATYDDRACKLMTLFSSGGQNNSDLPTESPYREVVPMALTLEYADGHSRITPWEIDYAPYNDPARNAFFRRMEAQE